MKTMAEAVEAVTVTVKAGTDMAAAMGDDSPQQRAIHEKLATYQCLEEEALALASVKSMVVAMVIAVAEGGRDPTRAMFSMLMNGICVGIEMEKHE